ncbi:type IV secretory system conjugative DNA transfer family protein [Labrys sp. 22185]|uniref:type IV secretory system conjugative DNA transfer family protein n=1 Tax=Labrys sp. 22185 TaxID=3453888 RepID=UPI003F87CF36
MKAFKFILALTGAIIAIAGVFVLWSFNYGLAYRFVVKSWTMMQSVRSGQLMLPYHQAWAYWDNANVSRIVRIGSTMTAVEAFLLGILAFLVIARPWQVKPPADGSRLATAADLRAADLLKGSPGKSVLLGTYNGKQVRYSGDSHFFVNGPSRSGKGRGFVMTNLLEWSGSAIVLDVKKENFNLTGAARLAMGQEVFLFAPGSEESHRWNPLDFVRPWPARATDLSNLAASLITIPEKGEAHWAETARALFAGLMGYVLESKTMEGRRHLRSVLRLFLTGQDFSSVLRRIVQDEPELNAFIINAMNGHLGYDEDQRPSFEGHIKTALKAWNNLLMASATMASDFDIRTLRSKPFSLFIAAPVSDFGTVEPIIRLLIQQIHDIMLRELPDKAKEPHKCLLMLDEFYQFERLPEIIKRAPLVAGYGLTIALVAQNIPQIDERYTVKTRDALLGNMDIQLYIGVGDETTARLVSENMGKHYVEREGWKAGRGLSASRSSSGGRYEAVPLMTSDAVRRLDQDHTILQIRGSYAAVLNKLNFYTDAEFLKRRREVASLNLKLPAPELKEALEWPLFEQNPARAAVEPPAVSEAGNEGATSRPATKLDSTPTRVSTAIIARAQAVFVSPDAFLGKVALALAASDNSPCTELLRSLRERPAIFGALRETASGSAGLLRRPVGASGQLEAIAALRDVIVAERRAKIAERAEQAELNAAELAVLRAANTGSATATASAAAVAAPGTVAQAEETEPASFSGAVEEPDSEPELEFDIASVAASADEVTTLDAIADEASARPEDSDQVQRFKQALERIRGVIAEGTADTIYFTGIAA